VGLTNSREATAFFVARAIAVAIFYVINPLLLAPLYMELVRAGNANLIALVSTGVSLVLWLATLLLFLALRAGFGGVPAMVAARRDAMTTSGAEIGSFLIAMLIVMAILWALTTFVMTGVYAALRQSGQMFLVLPVSISVSVVSAIVFFLLFIAMRSGMSGAPATDGQFDAYDVAPYDDSGASMGFGQAIATCFRKYAVFSGRASRSEYWFWALFQFLLLIVLSFADVALRGLGSVLALLAALVMFLPGLAVTVRRLHDSDKSGWWLFIWLVPLVGPITVIVFLCLRGTDGPNRFGMGPANAAIPEVFA